MVKKSSGLDAQFPVCSAGTHLKVGCNKCTVSCVKYSANSANLAMILSLVFL